MCDSILLYGTTLTADRTIKLVPTKSVLQIQFGDPIKLTEADFLRLSTAYFDEIESKYLAAAETRDHAVAVR